MCHALYLGADRPLAPLLPTTPPTFSVEPLDEAHAAVRDKFPCGWTVYFVGSHTGCSCGFHSPGAADDGEGFEDEALAGEAAARLRLAEYVAGALGTGARVALYDCWDGDEADPPLCATSATVAALARARDPVPEGTLVTVERACD